MPSRKRPCLRPERLDSRCTLYRAAYLAAGCQSVRYQRQLHKTITLMSKRSADPKGTGMFRNLEPTISVTATAYEVTTKTIVLTRFMTLQRLLSA